MPMDPNDKKKADKIVKEMAGIVMKQRDMVKELAQLTSQDKALAALTTAASDAYLAFAKAQRKVFDALTA